MNVILKTSTTDYIAAHLHLSFRHNACNDIACSRSQQYTHNILSSGWPNWRCALWRNVIPRHLLEQTSFQVVRQTDSRYANAHATHNSLHIWQCQSGAFITNHRLFDIQWLNGENVRSLKYELTFPLSVKITKHNV